MPPRASDQITSFTLFLLSSETRFLKENLPSWKLYENNPYYKNLLHPKMYKCPNQVNFRQGVIWKWMKIIFQLHVHMWKLKTPRKDLLICVIEKIVKITDFPYICSCKMQSIYPFNNAPNIGKIKIVGKKIFSSMSEWVSTLLEFRNGLALVQEKRLQMTGTNLYGNEHFSIFSPPLR